jgi:predicted RNase H-like HicB family nuclease
MSDYHINVLWSDEDDCYIADIPDLKYCSAHGSTPQEALAEVLIAKDLWLEDARDKGDGVPPPRYRPVIYEAFGGPQVGRPRARRAKRTESASPNARLSG